MKMKIIVRFECCPAVLIIIIKSKAVGITGDSLEGALNDALKNDDAVKELAKEGQTFDAEGTDLLNENFYLYLS